MTAAAGHATARNAHDSAYDATLVGDGDDGGAADAEDGGRPRVYRGRLHDGDDGARERGVA